jgi:hypothetical protein
MILGQQYMKPQVTSQPQVPAPIVYPEVQPIYASHSMPSNYVRSNTIYSTISADSVFGVRAPPNILTKFAESLPTGACIAGGSVMSALLNETTATDIDIFFTSAHAFEVVYTMLSNTSSGSALFSGYSTDTKLDDVKTDNNIRFIKFTNKDTNYKPIQLIKMVWFDSPDHVIDSFDFTVTQFALHKNDLIFNPIAFADLYRKRLVINRIQHPTTTLRRLIKYTNKGYYADQRMLLQIAEKIKVAAELADPDLHINGGY